MKITKKLVTLSVFSIIVLALAGCQRSKTGDAVADNGLNAFTDIIKTYPENKGFHEAMQHWGFKFSTGEKFEWSEDTSANKADFAMVLLADPLVEAGLNVDKLDKNEWLYEPAGVDDMGEDLPNRLIKLYNVSDNKEKANGSEDSMRRLLKADTNIIKYHEEQQHYRLLLGDGNEVQWTEKLGINDADMIFVIKAQPLIEAGLDINQLDGSGWIFQEASKDNAGMGENPDQIVKIFDISK